MPNGFFILDDNDILVLSESGSPIEKQEVTVRGTVHTYSAPELKSRFSWFKSDAELDAQYKNRAVIVAAQLSAAAEIALDIRGDQLQPQRRGGGRQRGAALDRIPEHSGTSVRAHGDASHSSADARSRNTLTSSGLSSRKSPYIRASPKTTSCGATTATRQVCRA